MFKAVITEQYTAIQGDTTDVLAGLACYIEALKKKGIPKRLIKKVVNMGLEDDKEEKVETIFDNGKTEVKKFDLNGLSKEEAEQLLKKELFDKLLD